MPEYLIYPLRGSTTFRRKEASSPELALKETYLDDHSLEVRRRVVIELSPRVEPVDSSLRAAIAAALTPQLSMRAWEVTEAGTLSPIPAAGLCRSVITELGDIVYE